jgi:hypothetical protein
MGTSMSIGLPVAFKRFEIGVAYSTPATDTEQLDSQIAIAAIVTHAICRYGLVSLSPTDASKLRLRSLEACV